MIYLLLPAALAGGAYIWHRQSKTKKSLALTPKVNPRQAGAMAGPGMTPARAAVHGELMQKEMRPNKLDKAAGLFGAEGLMPQAAALANKANQIRQQASGAADLVTRARAGDQNALAMIACIREQAHAGSPRARVSASLIEDYCKNVPNEAAA